MSAILLTAPTKQQQSKPLAERSAPHADTKLFGAMPTDLCSGPYMVMYEQTRAWAPGGGQQVDNDADNESDGSARTDANPRAIPALSYAG